MWWPVHGGRAEAPGTESRDCALRRCSWAEPCGGCTEHPGLTAASPQAARDCSGHEKSAWTSLQGVSMRMRSSPILFKGPGFCPGTSSHSLLHWAECLQLEGILPVSQGWLPPPKSPNPSIAQGRAVTGGGVIQAQAVHVDCSHHIPARGTAQQCVRSRDETHSHATVTDNQSRATQRYRT